MVPVCWDEFMKYLDQFMYHNEISTTEEIYCQTELKMLAQILIHCIIQCTHVQLEYYTSISEY